MQAITQNSITQEMHGTWNAVDYSARPDPIAYAPETVTFESFNPNNGDCGRSLYVKGPTGRHGFCHLEGDPFIKPNQTFQRGQPLFKMGYTGKTIPPGENGRHAHWILNKNGVWIYPPSLINEPFIKQGGDMPTKVDDGNISLLYVSVLHRHPTQADKDARRGQDYIKAQDELYQSKEWADQDAKVKAPSKYKPAGTIYVEDK